ncbi:MAG: hypothetical protein EHM61_14855 [Acidobacteria bacterium]|nr:MAG: hypothetical protein EHM61_14855 [Acidobacteriota bacterium]
MDTFIQKYEGDVMGSLSGLDRLVLSGRLRMLSFSAGMMGLLSQASVLLKNFGAYAESKTKQLREASEATAQRLQRPLPYLRSSKISKEDTARQIAERDGVKAGLICVIKAVEPCLGYDVESQDGRLRLVLRPRKCLFLYHYFIHPIFGFMHARLQTWFPFPIQLCLNGREWLARQMDRAGVSYERVDNCFPWLEKLATAQELAREQLRLNWVPVLNRIAQEINPALETMLAPYRAVQYYWSVRESEWATDIMFRDTARLDTFYPSWIRTAIAGFGSGNVLRFLGQKLWARSKEPVEVTSSYKNRPEGVRVKHSVGVNSVKAYNKAGSILRVETTMNDAKGFGYRRRREDGTGSERWRPLATGSPICSSEPRSRKALTSVICKLWRLSKSINPWNNWSLPCALGFSGRADPSAPSPPGRRPTKPCWQQSTVANSSLPASGTVMCSESFTANLMILITPNVWRAR